MKESFSEGIDYSTHQQQEISVNQIVIKEAIQCRICLENANQSSRQLISPCQCSGSVKYVHNQCIQQWISKIIGNCKKQIGNGRAHISCQLCHTNISFETQKHLQCKTLQQIKEKFKQSLRNFILLLILMLANLCLFLALLDYLISFGFSTLLEKNAILVSLIISGQVILSLVAIVSGCFLVKNYLLKTKILVFRVKAQSYYENKPTFHSQIQQNKQEQLQP